MALFQIGASILISLLIAILTRATRSLRTYLLLAFSVLAIYWFQPLLPLRSFDFWLPSLSLAFVILTWLVTSQSDGWRMRQNIIGLLIIIGLVTVINLSRYFLPDPILTASTPPQFAHYFVFILVIGITILTLAWSSYRSKWIIRSTIVLLIVVLVLLKNPALGLQTSIFFRTLTNRSVENASFTDLRWLGFSYIAFRLIHILRDKQMARLPELSLPEFATYVVFFPSLVAGPIDRAERFAQDLRKDFSLSQDEILLAGQRIFLGLFKKFVIADALALIALNDSLATQVRTTGWMWIVVYAYTFQIYFDFSGYTDIAIGTARLVGIKLPENFAAPYSRPNLTQFWNNWHMTLTQWVRSYFFNPFNRWMRGFKNLPAWVMILVGQIATMLLIGLWHGITLNFIFWGIWHGLGLFLQNRWSDFVRRRYPDVGKNTRLQPGLQISGILLTFHFVALGWVFFALSMPSLSWLVLRKLFGL
ncbi:MAG TPA: MBOAT family O-acyltransferase [Anaerolineales bacterium]|nr:MBOAT family O-acyltransferase [Anaerolineales bacterium]